MKLKLTTELSWVEIVVVPVEVLFELLVIIVSQVLLVGL
jgi:hypothetical protein